MTSQNSTNNVKVKNEKRDDDEEINQLAAKMVAENKAKMSNLANNTNPIQPGQALSMVRPGQPTIQNFFTRPNNNASAPTNVIINNAKPDSAGLSKPVYQPVVMDEESQKGRFGWREHPIPFPYIYRGHDKYVSVRIFETKVLQLRKFASLMRPEIYNCVCIKSYYVTEAEVKLLNDINVKHCDWYYGKEVFTTKDLLVQLSDAEEFLQFLELCQTKLLTRTSNAKDRCGFFKISGEHVVPFTCRGITKFVPLFYFEGEMESLRKKAEEISGWDLAYLKFCCKVQGIRNELFANDTYHAVSMDDIRKHFPADATFQEYWPSRSMLELTPLTNAQAMQYLHGNWVRKPLAPPAPSPTQVIRPVPQAVNNARANLSLTSGAVLPAAAKATGRAQTSSSSSSAAAAAASSSSSSSAVQAAWRGAPPLPVSSASSVLGNALTYAGWSNSLLNSQLNSLAYNALQNQAPPAPQPVNNVNHIPSAANPSPAHLASMQMNPNYLFQSMQQLAQVQAHYEASRNSTQLMDAANQSHILRNGLPSTMRPALYGNSTPYSSLNTPTTAASLPSHRPAHYPSQSPLSGVVPGSSPQTRNGAGASPRPGNPVPANPVSKPPPPLIPFHGLANGHHSSRIPSASAATSSSSRRGSEESSRLHTPSPSGNHIPSSPTAHAQTMAAQSNNNPPYKLQKIAVDNLFVPCINSRQYVYNNFMMTLQDMVTYLFPAFSVQNCRQVLEKVFNVTIYDANAEQMECFREASKCSSLTEKIPLVNVRDVIKYVAQIKYIMSSVSEVNTNGNGAPTAKRQRIS